MKAGYLSFHMLCWTTSNSTESRHTTMDMKPLADSAPPQFLTATPCPISFSSPLCLLVFRRYE